MSLRFEQGPCFVFTDCLCRLKYKGMELGRTGNTNLSICNYIYLRTSLSLSLSLSLFLSLSPPLSRTQVRLEIRKQGIVGFSNGPSSLVFREGRNHVLSLY